MKDPNVAAVERNTARILDACDGAAPEVFCIAAINAAVKVLAMVNGCGPRDALIGLQATIGAMLDAEAHRLGQS